MLIAQITDLHVRPRGLSANRVVETNMMTERAIDAVIALRPRPDVVLITGDLTDCGLVEEYEQLKIMLRRLDLPALLIPGNHDRRENLRRVLADCDRQAELRAKGYSRAAHFSWATAAEQTRRVYDSACAR